MKEAKAEYALGESLVFCYRAPCLLYRPHPRSPRKMSTNKDSITN